MLLKSNDLSVSLDQESPGAYTVSPWIARAGTTGWELAALGEGWSPLPFVPALTGPPSQATLRYARPWISVKPLRTMRGYGVGYGVGYASYLGHAPCLGHGHDMHVGLALDFRKNFSQRGSAARRPIYR